MKYLTALTTCLCCAAAIVTGTPDLSSLAAQTTIEHMPASLETEFALSALPPRLRVAGDPGEAVFGWQIDAFDDVCCHLMGLESLWRLPSHSQTAAPSLNCASTRSNPGSVTRSSACSTESSSSPKKGRG
jgi:hypothetical protein